MLNVSIYQLDMCKISSEGLFDLSFMPGAADYSAFPMLLKQLVTPLITQILDRRSSVVKQVGPFVV
jgi:hypothetical protein